MFFSHRRDRSLKSVIIGLALVGGLSSQALAWKDSDSVELVQAQRVLANLRNEFALANQELPKAGHRHIQAKKNLADAKQRVSEQIRSSADYQAARERLMESQSKLTAARQQVTSELCQDPTYQAAKKLLDTANAQQREVQRSGSVEARQAAAAEILNAKTNIKRLEDEALMKNHDAKVWSEKYKTSQQELLEWNRRLQSETEHDSTVIAAGRESSDSFRSIQNARRRVGDLRSTIAQQQHHVNVLSKQDDKSNNPSKSCKSDASDRRPSPDEVYRATGLSQFVYPVRRNR